MEITLKIVIEALYVIASLVVFFIQRAQISKLKSINESTANYANIFDPNKVKEYSELSNDISEMKLAKFKDGAIDKYAEDITELVVFVGHVLNNGDKEQVELVGNGYLKKTKGYFSDEFLAKLKNKT